MKKTKRDEPTDDIRSDVHAAAHWGNSVIDIARILNDKYPYLDATRLNDIIEEVTSKMPTYHLKQKIKRCRIVQDISGDDMCYMLDPSSKDVMRIKEAKITRLCSNREEKTALLKRIYPAQFTYNPFEATRLYRENLDWFYNSYIPPVWYEKVFYSKGLEVVEKRDTIPPLYEKFFIHLVKDHEKSYVYVLHWLSNAMKYRNYCVLTAIGSQGIGKGVLGEIMRLLAGEKNFHTSDTRLITKDFNNCLLYTSDAADE